MSDNRDHVAMVARWLRTDRERTPETAQPGSPLRSLYEDFVHQDVAIAFAEAADFKFIGSSGVNANPKDTKDYPGGVWTLPPTYKLGSQDRAKYEAIGESDRFILKFQKPGG
ncbi:hypothetical protein [Rhizobium tubonense]|uniref:hypothetical protein n=1 Tax=Rhizobium tubonense TaxID=484088 RepID=UPI0019D4C269|nr:hypothetical protein [Rhizobium tubonense]